MSNITPKLITERPMKGRTGIGQAFDEFVEETGLIFTKIKKW